MTNDTVYWYARLINNSSDTLQFDAPFGSSFFDWHLKDSTGREWDSFTRLDCLQTYLVLPGDSLTYRWTTPIYRPARPLPENLYYGLMKPWYKYDSLETDTASFIINKKSNIQEPPQPNKVENFEITRLYPNPFNATLNINFTIRSEGPYELSIFDLSGRRLATLVNTRLYMGNYSFTWDAGELSSGVYLVRLSDGKQVLTLKALLVK